MPKRPRSHRRDNGSHARGVGRHAQGVFIPQNQRDQARAERELRERVESPNPEVAPTDIHQPSQNQIPKAQRVEAAKPAAPIAVKGKKVTHWGRYGAAIAGGTALAGGAGYLAMRARRRRQEGVVKIDDPFSGVSYELVTKASSNGRTAAAGGAGVAVGAGSLYGSQKLAGHIRRKNIKRLKRSLSEWEKLGGAAVHKAHDARNAAIAGGAAAGGGIGGYYGGRAIARKIKKPRKAPGGVRRMSEWEKLGGKAVRKAYGTPYISAGVLVPTPGDFHAASHANRLVAIHHASRAQNERQRLVDVRNKKFSQVRKSGAADHGMRFPTLAMAANSRGRKLEEF